MKQFTWVFLLLLLGCATVPYTKRHQLSLVSQADEIKFGQDAYVEVLKKNPPVTDAAVKAGYAPLGPALPRQLISPILSGNLTSFLEKR